MQVIFESNNGPPDKRWLDYCREKSPHADKIRTDIWARGWCDTLQRRECVAFRYRVEEW